MPVFILMPALSPTMESGTLAKWTKKEGDAVKSGDVIAEIETDKAIMEFESADSGILAKILVEGNSKNIPINSPIAVMLKKNESHDMLNAFLKSHSETESLAIKEIGTLETTIIASDPSLNTSTSGLSAIEDTAKHDASLNCHDSYHEGSQRIFITPLARNVAKEHSIDLAKVSGSGPNGRIIKVDVLNAITANEQKSSSGLAISSTYSPARNPQTPSEVQEYSTVPISTMRSVIARRLTESKRDIPHFYLNVIVNVDCMLQLRTQLNDGLAKEATFSPGCDPAKISVNDMLTKAVGVALHRVPAMNASWHNDHIRQYHTANIAIAVALPDGLITPIISNVAQKSLVTLSKEIKQMVSRANEGKLMAHEYQGGSFTISNLGMYGVESFTAIVNPPQSGILAVGAAKQEVVVINNQISIGNTLHLTLSCDHRVVDGATAAKFLQALRDLIESPIILI